MSPFPWGLVLKGTRLASFEHPKATGIPEEYSRVGLRAWAGAGEVMPDLGEP